MNASVSRNTVVKIFLLSVFTLLLAGMAVAQKPAPLTGPTTTTRTATTFATTTPSDPGVRGGVSGSGNSLSGLSSDETNFFNAARSRFQEVDSVTGTAVDASGKLEAGVGLGPRFNGNSCAQCHAFPAVGGSSPVTVNPQVALATLNGATNTLPKFIHSPGPVREVRFINNPDGTADGGVHDLFTITGRTDAPGCNISQDAFDTQNANGNAIARIPTPTFGLGLVELTSDTTLTNDANNANNANNGISGTFNHSGNDGTITRFGWKAQNKSLLIFAGEAYNVEQGVSNELFPQERDETPGCQFNSLPEDTTNLTNGFNSGSNASDFAADTVNFAGFMRLLAAPTAAAPTASSTRGQQTFISVGCALCHVQSHTTVAKTSVSNQGNVTYSPWSDFSTHLMGDGLYDGVTQGIVGTEHFRTAPLWGVGQRSFFLHDGRTNNLLTAIQAHSSNGSEANTVISNFNLLSASQQQDVLNFLRSL
ncbi:MAG TPA: di-heme oxidoredictase family protein [Candidatus Angelobacter sp.]|nr:di-heme oxidoredictase family protein [Candidatus Angelobacter sp.]